MPNEIYNKKDNRFDRDAVDVFLRMHSEVSHHTVEAIKLFMERNAYYMTSSQLRNVYARLKAARDPAQVPLMRVKLAYIQGRTEQNNRGMLTLLDLLDQMMQRIGPEDTERLKGLLAFFEAVLAYHKYYETIKPSRP